MWWLTGGGNAIVAAGTQYPLRQDCVRKDHFFVVGSFNPS